MTRFLDDVCQPVPPHLTTDSGRTKPMMLQSYWHRAAALALNSEEPAHL
jgi:hypothetical protein